MLVGGDVWRRVMAEGRWLELGSGGLTKCRACYVEDEELSREAVFFLRPIRFACG